MTTRYSREMGGSINHMADWARARMPKSARRYLRALTDPFSGPLGSIRSVSTNSPVVALTFDDGPDPERTPGVLDVLSEHGAKATWFVMLDRAEENPELVLRMLAEGHDVGLHGVDHQRLTNLAGREAQRHIASGVQRLSQLLGAPIRFFRPPYGAQSVTTYLAARRLGLEVVVWSADCDDWNDHPEAEIADLVLSAATPGAILLLHDSLADSATQPGLERAEVARRVVKGLAARGMGSVALGALLESGNPSRTLWFRS